MYETLATHRRLVEQIRSEWLGFLAKRRERLIQQKQHGVAAEKVAENILEALFTMVLGWTLADMNNQVGYADLLLTRLGIKYLLVEVKYPGALAWQQRAVEAAATAAGAAAAATAGVAAAVRATNEHRGAGGRSRVHRPAAPGR